MNLKMKGITKMKKINCIMSVVLTIAILLSVAVPVFAVNIESQPAGVYGTITGRLWAVNSFTFSGTTTVTNNPCRAKLYIQFEVHTDGSTIIACPTKASTAGVTSFSSSYACSDASIYGEEIEYCFGCHQVRGSRGDYYVTVLTYV